MTLVELFFYLLISFTSSSS